MVLTDTKIKAAMQLVKCGNCGAGHSLVSDIIDFEQREDGMMIAYGVCDQLDDMKHTYHGLPDFLTKVHVYAAHPPAT